MCAQSVTEVQDLAKELVKRQIDGKVVISDVLPERSENVNMHMHVLSTSIRSNSSATH